MKTVNGVVTAFLDDGDNEIAEYDGSGNLLRRYIPGPSIDDVVEMVNADNSYAFPHADHHGSVVEMSAAGGAIEEGPYVYDAYGNVSASTGYPFKFTGQRIDPETGLYYYRARYYSSSLGRFLQTDPIGYDDDINWYNLVRNDPTDKSDPTGLCDDVNGCGPSAVASQRVLDSPAGMQGQLGGAKAGAAAIALTVAPEAFAAGAGVEVVAQEFSNVTSGKSMTNIDPGEVASAGTTTVLAGPAGKLASSTATKALGRLADSPSGQKTIRAVERFAAGATSSGMQAYSRTGSVSRAGWAAVLGGAAAVWGGRAADLVDPSLGSKAAGAFGIGVEGALDSIPPPPESTPKSY